MIAVLRRNPRTIIYDLDLNVSGVSVRCKNLDQALGLPFGLAPLGMTGCSIPYMLSVLWCEELRCSAIPKN